MLEIHVKGGNVLLRCFTLLLGVLKWYIVSWKSLAIPPKVKHRVYHMTQ